MLIEFHSKFEKDLKPLPIQAKKAVWQFIKEVKSANSLRDLRDCLPLEGYSNAYRLRRGDYRIIIVFVIENNMVIARRILSRGQVYKKHNF